MEALTGFLQLLQLGQLLAFLKDYPGAGMTFGGLAVVLAFLINVGPLKRIQVDTLVGKAIALSAVVVMLLGAGWMVLGAVADEVEELRSQPPRAERENDPVKRPPGAGQRKACAIWDNEAGRCLQ